MLLFDSIRQFPSNGLLIWLCVTVTRPQLAVRGSMELSSAVLGMTWDGQAGDGLAMTSDGAIWYTRWGVQPCRLMTGSTSPIVGLSSLRGAVSTILTASKAGPLCATVFDGTEWEHVLSLRGCDDDHTTPSVMVCQSCDDPTVVVGFSNGSVCGYKLASSTPAFQVRVFVGADSLFPRLFFMQCAFVSVLNSIVTTQLKCQPHALWRHHMDHFW